MSLLVVGATLFGLAQGHMSPFMRSMYGVGGSRTGQDWTYAAGDPVSPIGPNVATQDAWWFRGPGYRALAPPAGAVTELPAGGTIMLEIACHIAWTSVGWSTTVPGSPLDACPGGTAGAYHSGDPNAYTIDPSLLSGCALGIANVDDIAETTMDNLVIFSVQPNCVQTKQTTFDIPAMMPACTGSKCICAWFWLANTGTSNFYMTAFDCNVTNVSPQATAIAPPQDPIYCLPGGTCTPTVGAKRPLYAYNSPTNCAWLGDPALFNSNRPGYHAAWSFSNGAQNDIFVAAGAAVSQVNSVVSQVNSVVSQVASVVSNILPTLTLLDPITAAPSATGPNSRELAISSRIASQKAATRLAAIAARKSSVAAAAFAAKTRTATAQKARRTLALSPEVAAPANTQGSVDVSTHQASLNLLEQMRDSDALNGQFEEQEWSAIARGF